jgi:hypothetical protein
MATRAADSPTILQALTSLSGEVDGAVVNISSGDLIDADHPAVRKWPTSFGPVTVLHRSPVRESAVEQATAAPGEKRGR